MNILLVPFSLIYTALSWLLKKTRKAHALPKTVISVGNITWGGSGKTPVVARIAKDILERGMLPAVLSRGYGRKSSSLKIFVADPKDASCSVDSCGDEPFMLACQVPGALVISSPNRRRGADYALKNYPVDVFILDDGFQHWALKRNVDIVCVNALNPFGNGFLIPAGILREGLKAFKRASFVVINNCDKVEPEEVARLQSTISKYANCPIALCKYVVSDIKRVVDGTIYPVGKFFGRQAIALCAIAENRSFIDTLHGIEMSVAKRFAFRDHHWYKVRELVDILTTSVDRIPVVTTSKDAVRLKDALARLDPKSAERFYEVRIKLEFIQGEELWLEMLQLIKAPPSF
ncbi:MAG: tetraacyldisaccharide 4'-kinase [Endomicrobiales bacterium]|nr:tetraacyldisaccharide 4'-kinase [Endomicrobiales bacterium]